MTTPVEFDWYRKPAVGDALTSHGLDISGGLASIMCNNHSMSVFGAFLITYLVALGFVALNDDRFIKDFWQFRLRPFSQKRFGAAGIVNIFAFVAFFAVGTTQLKACK